MPVHEKWHEGQWVIVRRLFEQGAPHLEASDCTLLAVRGLVGWPLIQLCRERKWHYLLRVCTAHPCRR